MQLLNYYPIIIDIVGLELICDMINVFSLNLLCKYKRTIINYFKTLNLKTWGTNCLIDNQYVNLNFFNKCSALLKRTLNLSLISKKTCCLVIVVLCYLAENSTFHWQNFRILECQILTLRGLFTTFTEENKQE